MKYALPVLLCVLLFVLAGCAQPGKRTFLSDFAEGLSEEFEYFYFDTEDAMNSFSLDRESAQYLFGVDGGEEE